MIGKIKFRFLDHALARKYDADGMATALFTTVGCANASSETSWRWPLTIIVPSNVIERLRRVLLIIIAFKCTDTRERTTILSEIVATASFFCEAVAPASDDSSDLASKTKDTAEKDRERSDSACNAIKGWFGIVDHTIQLKTNEDVRQVLLGLYPNGGDLTIWIKTSPPPRTLRKMSRGVRGAFSPPSQSPTNNQNRDPNKRRGIVYRLPSPTSSPNRSLSSTLKAIEKVANGGCRRSRTPKIAKRPQQRHFGSSNIVNEEKTNSRAPPSPVNLEFNLASIILESDSPRIVEESIPIPGFPVFSDFAIPLHAIRYENNSANGRISLTTDDTIATTSVATSSSITLDSSISDAMQEDLGGLDPNNDGDDSDNENRLLLALAGCAPIDHRRGIDCYHEDRGLLEGLLTCDDGYIDDEDNNDHSESARDYDSANSSSSNLGNNPRDVDANDGNEDNDPVMFKGAGTSDYLTPSFFDTKTSLTLDPFDVSNTLSNACCTVVYRSWSPSSENNAIFCSLKPTPSLSMIGCTGYGVLSRPRNPDTIIFESSSLWHGSELDMVTVLESVLGSILLPEDGNKIPFGNYDGSFRVLPKMNPECYLHREYLLSYPCPTPKELLAIDRNNLAKCKLPR